MDDYTKANLEWWNEAAIVHSHSQGDIYELKSFKAGKTKLLPLELEEVGDVAGKRLLHLQCHFGMDTLSWARLGAKVTGTFYTNTHFAHGNLSPIWIWRKARIDSCASKIRQRGK